MRILVFSLWKCKNSKWLRLKVVKLINLPSISEVVVGCIKCLHSSDGLLDIVCKAMGVLVWSAAEPPAPPGPAPASQRGLLHRQLSDRRTPATAR